MAYDPEQLFEKAIETIKSNSQVVFMEDVIANLPCSKVTFYEHFPAESNELNTLKELLDINKTNLKQGLRYKWENAESAPLQLALYKLVSTPDEARALSMQHIDHTTKGEAISASPIILSSPKGDEPDEL